MAEVLSPDGRGIRRLPERLGPGFWLILLYAVLLVALIVTSTPRHSGDAAEYLGMSNNLRQLRAPSLNEAEMAEARALFEKWGSGYDTPGAFLAVPELRGDDGRQDFLHFWFYPVLAAPGLALTEALGRHPTYAFALTNLLLLVIAAAVVARRLHWAAVALVFVGPIVWWVDKAQTEAFTFSMLAIALVLLRERPWWSFVCLGAASTQNLPIAGALVLAVIAAVAVNRAWLRTRAFWVGLGVGVGLALLAPIYYLIRIGKVSSLVGSAEPRSRLPSWAEFKVPLLDLNSGLVVNAPVLVITVGVIALALLLNHRRRLWNPPLIVAVLMAVIFLISFSQIANVNAGGTPRLTRYALWLIPLAIPLLLLAQDTLGPRFERWLVPVAVASAALSVATFAPRWSDNYLHPTPVADWVWTHQPGWDNPLPEIFFERTRHEELPPEPVANSSCAKLLLIDGTPPKECPVASVPDKCAHGPCYANRSGGTYDFVRAAVVKR